MAKTKRSTAADKTRVVVPPTVPMIDMGKKVPVTVKKASAEGIQYTLSDGTIFNLKPVILSIERSLEAFNPEGDPVYQISSGIVIQTIVPKRLKRKM